MIIRFNHEFSLPAQEVYSYFQTPADWTRLYGLAGDAKDFRWWQGIRSRELMNSSGGCSGDFGVVKERYVSLEVPMGSSLKATRK
jgi:hypothetical protein